MTHISPTAVTAQIASSILYLRSFTDEKFTSRPLGDNAFWPFSVRTDEERLVELLRSAGPVVAVGQPGEKLPELGAARTYLPEHAWQTVVANWIASARLVVIRIGASEGVWWEIRMSISRIDPRSVILLVPDSEDAYSAFCQRFEEEFLGSAALPTAIRVSRGGFGLQLDGFIYFDGNWNGHYVRMGRSTRQMRKALARALARLDQLDL
jgi:hypothetical protein